MRLNCLPRAAGAEHAATAARTNSGQRAAPSRVRRSLARSRSARVPRRKRSSNSNSVPSCERRAPARLRARTAKLLLRLLSVDRAMLTTAVSATSRAASSEPHRPLSGDLDNLGDPGGLPGVALDVPNCRACERFSAGGILGGAIASQPRNSCPSGFRARTPKAECARAQFLTINQAQGSSLKLPASINSGLASVASGSVKPTHQ